MAEGEATHHEPSVHATGGALKKHWKLLLIIGGGLILFLWWRSRATGSAATVSSPTSGTSTAVTSPVSTVTSPTSTVSTGVGTGSGGQTVSQPGSYSPGSRATTSTSGTSTIKTAASKFTTKLTNPSGYQQASSFAQAVADAKAGENVLYRNNLTDAFGALNPGTGTTPKNATIFVPTTVSTAAKAVGANSTYSTPPARDGNYTKFLGTFGTANEANAAVKKMGLGNNYLLATNGANASYTIWGP